VNVARLLAGAGGVVVAVVGVLVALFGGFGGFVAGLVSAFGNDYFLVSAFGVVAVAAAAIVQVSRARSGLDQADPPTVEEVHTVPRLGADLDAFLDPDADVTADPERVRASLRELAVSLETREQARSRREARRRVDDGDWTDDDVAAAYLSDALSMPRRERSIAGLRGEPAAQLGARRAGLELDRLVRETFDLPSPPDAPQGADRHGRAGATGASDDRPGGSRIGPQRPGHASTEGTPLADGPPSRERPGDEPGASEVAE